MINPHKTPKAVTGGRAEHTRAARDAEEHRVARMGISPHLARLRAVIGHELLVLPCVTVLPVRSMSASQPSESLSVGTPEPGCVQA